MFTYVCIHDITYQRLIKQGKATHNICVHVHVYCERNLGFLNVTGVVCYPETLVPVNQY